MREVSDGGLSVVRQVIRNRHDAVVGQLIGPALTIEALGIARELQKERFSSESIQYGVACFTQARAVVRHANDSVALTAAQREELVGQAAKLSIEASDSFDAAYMSHEGDEYVETILEAILTGGEPNRLAALPGCASPVHALRKAASQTLYDADADSALAAVQDLLAAPDLAMEESPLSRSVQSMGMGDTAETPPSQRQVLLENLYEAFAVGTGQV